MITVGKKISPQLKQPKKDCVKIEQKKNPSLTRFEFFSWYSTTYFHVTSK